MNAIAPDGQVFVCGACGKRSRDRYGNLKINFGWDESCMLNCILCYEDKLVIENGRVTKVEDGGVVLLPKDDEDKTCKHCGDVSDS